MLSRDVAVTIWVGRSARCAFTIAADAPVLPQHVTTRWLGHRPRQWGTDECAAYARGIDMVLAEARRRRAAMQVDPTAPLTVPVAAEWHLLKLRQRPVERCLDVARATLSETITDAAQRAELRRRQR